MRNYHFRHTGVLFPVTLIPVAAYELSYECRVSGAAECLRCQFAGVAPLRSALHSYRTFTTRGLYLIDRCSFDSVVLQVYPMRNYHFRHTGVLFPVTLIPVAAYEAFLRVQSERSERLRELHEVQGSRELAPWRGPGEQPGQVWARVSAPASPRPQAPAAQHRRHAGTEINNFNICI